MKMITISREFGSGGRELGKRLADYFGIPCYDHEIIDMVAEKQGLNKEYVARVSEKSLQTFYPTTIGRRFYVPNAIIRQSVDISVGQQNILKELAAQGDCVIVGRCADVVLKEWKPFKVFVYADTASKLQRCVDREKGGEQLSEKEIIRKMRQIDKERADYRSLFTDEGWGRPQSYHLCVNTSGREIKSLVPGLAAYIDSWLQDAGKKGGTEEN